MRSGQKTMNEFEPVSTESLFSLNQDLALEYWNIQNLHSIQRNIAMFYKNHVFLRYRTESMLSRVTGATQVSVVPWFHFCDPLYNVKEVVPSYYTQFHNLGTFSHVDNLH
jgi:hypothetical protein